MSRKKKVESQVEEDIVSSEVEDAEEEQVESYEAEDSADETTEESNIPGPEGRKVIEDDEMDNPDEAPTRNKVYVAFNDAHGQWFFAAGKWHLVKGFTVNRLLKYDGTAIPGGRFGITEMDKDLWDEIVKRYSNMVLFKSGNLFWADSLDDLKQEIKGRTDLRHGLEPIDQFALADIKPVSKKEMASMGR